STLYTDQTVVNDTAYSPYGDIYDNTASSNLDFTGQFQDTQSGLYDFQAREYSTVGRWISPDPAGLNAADITDPQSWNRYAYVSNRPLYTVDPTGLGQCPIPPNQVQAVCQGGSYSGLSMLLYFTYGFGEPTYDTTTTIVGYTADNEYTFNPDTGEWDNLVSAGETAVTETNTYLLSSGNSVFAANNGNIGTISAGDPNAKKNFCSHQANLAAAEAVLPGLANAIQGDFRPIAASATSEVVQDYAMDAAANSTSFLLTVRSWTGIPMSVTSKALSIVGYVGTAYTAYSALKAAQTEYAACMQ
ncbi:MAG: RHS repeat-associated core domain-containing protein, partial [Candidatus Sulfotelmatobacter sp.]